MKRSRLPEWFRVSLPSGQNYGKLNASLKKLGLATVCDEAVCPNRGECWSAGTATIMVLGDVCTRACRFCSVKTGKPDKAPDSLEPKHVAEAVRKMVKEAGVSYVVITSVDRDDLEDFGAGHYAACIEYIKKIVPEIKLEVLSPDFQGCPKAVEKIISAKPDVFGHNIETVSRLHRKVRDARAGYEQSLKVLETARKMGAAHTKSGLMLGHGESLSEVLETMRDLKSAGVDILTIGQYLQPTLKQLPVERIWMPEEFENIRCEGEKMGFAGVAAGPLVRSSYRAAENYNKAVQKALSGEKTVQET